MPGLTLPSTSTPTTGNTSMKERAGNGHLSPSSSGVHPQTPADMSTPTKQAVRMMDDAAAAQLELHLHETLHACNRLAKHTYSEVDLDTLSKSSEAQGLGLGLGHEIAMAKMLNYCIRMLHADGWHPPTVIRAMVMKERGLGGAMRGTMYKALRERRDEITGAIQARQEVQQGVNSGGGGDREHAGTRQRRQRESGTRRARDGARIRAASDSASQVLEHGRAVGLI